MLKILKNNIAGIYLITSLCWITISDLYINKIDHTTLLYDALQMGKGIVYVVITTVLLHFIIKKHKAHKQAEENQNELLTLINSMPDFVNFKDADGRWLKVNEFGKDLYLLHDVNYEGKTDVELAELVPFFKEAFQYCVKSDQRAWEIGQLSRCEESFPVPSGEIKTFDVIKVPLYDENNQKKGLLTIGRDITQQKATEAMLLKKEKLSVVGELAAGIAHEIRNPLTSLKGFIQLMRETKNPPKKHYEIMLTELDRINQIVSEMLVFSKPQSKLFKSFRLHDLIEYMMKISSHEATLYGIEIKVENNTSNPNLYGDINQLIQVFINIIKNSIDAMPKGGEITIRINESQGMVTIQITDTGIGIPLERLERIGEPFFTLKEKGMGLGLTISNKIIHDHKGTLRIESEEGKGTIVSVSIPTYGEIEKEIE